MRPYTTHFLSEPRHVSEHAKAIRCSSSIGIDTEFVRERTFRPRPGLVQISDGEQVWLLDPVALAGEDAFHELLAELLRDPATCKILHSTGEDLEVLDILADARPSPLFDTQRAAALLGWPLQIRYETLAAELLGIEFPGGLARNDWCRRPLPEAWLEYAAHDVIALPDIRAELSERLQQQGRLAWLEEDCRRLIELREEPDPVIRIRGAGRLDDQQLERLSRLADWRDAEARRRDLPRSFVVADAVLLELVQPHRIDDRLLDQLGRMKPPLPKRYRKAVADVLATEPRTFQRPAELQPLTQQQRSRLGDLKTRVAGIAESLGLEPAIIASRRDLTRLVQGSDCAWLHGWRGELLGDLRGVLPEIAKGG
ncbi:MAG: ribonuclease D [Wenzhouxiangellaceae bacterium]